jgi:hypothetical protein
LLHKIFPDLSNEEVNAIENHITFLKNNNLIKKPSFIKKAVDLGVQFFLKVENKAIRYDKTENCHK